MHTPFLTLDEARQRIASGVLSAQNLLQVCQQQIEQYNPSLNAFITLSPGQHCDLAELRIANKGQVKRLLWGVPVAAKDMFASVGMPTTAGSLFFEDFMPGQDAFAVRRLKASGAVVVGKTNTHELALGVTNVNPHFGVCRNPWNLDHISGGSSGGSAVAVASGMCLGALGTDTGGSIRIPAALCGVVGLKPTYGRVSLRGGVPLAWSLDHAGPLARTVRDVALLLQIIAGYDRADPACVDWPVADYPANLHGGIEGWRIAVAAGEYVEGCTGEVSNAVEAAAEVLATLGAQVKRVEMSWLQAAARANTLMLQAEAAAFHRQRWQSHPEKFGADVLQRLRTGAAVTSSEYALARRRQVALVRRFERFFQRYDLLVLPTTPTTAPTIADEDALARAGSLTRFTAPFNLAGLPALSVPCGFDSQGLPVGLQIVSKRWAEATVLRAGHAFQQATGFHNKHPNLA